MLNLKNLYLRPTIIMIITLLISLTATISIGLEYYFLKDLAYTSTSKLIKQINEQTQKKVQTLEEESQNYISILELTHNIGAYPNSNIQPLFLRKITTMIKNKPYIYAIYVGYKNNSFYEVINLDIDKNLRNKFSAKTDEKWLIIKIFNKDKKRMRLEQFLDNDLIVKRNIFKEPKYLPTQRPWFIDAYKNKEQIIKTEPYLFSNLNNYGVTFAKKILDKNAVIALDISLKSLSGFLKSHTTIPGTKLYLFNEKHDLIASNKGKDDLFVTPKNLNINSTSNDLNTTNIGGEDYFTSYQKIVSKNDKYSYLLTLIPENKIMEESNKKIFIAISVTLLFIIILLPLIWISTKLFTKPLEKLEIENKKIKNRNFDDIKQIDTPINEIFDLSKSFVEMSKSIKAYEDSQEEFIDSIVKLIATTIDAKSKYTAGHCERVPTLTLMLANEVSKSNADVFKDITFHTKEQMRELSIASWLHDCGKVTTPIFVVDKATKLETIYNRIHEIRTRFEVLHRDFTISSLKEIISGKDERLVNLELVAKHNKLIEDFTFIAKTNVGTEFMDNKDIEKINSIAKYEWERYFDNGIGLSYEEESRFIKTESSKEFVLEDKDSHIIPRPEEEYKDYDNYGFKMDIPDNLYNLGEIYNLSINKGTLTTEERFKINEHIIMTIKMLEALPLPEHLSRVPEYAGAHHETLIGTGYPRKLTEEQMSVPARMMAIADVFEALTASDRPYKKAKTLSESIKILSFMVKDKHLDKDIFEVFLKSGIYLKYGRKYLDKDQLDNVDISEYID